MIKDVCCVLVQVHVCKYMQNEKQIVASVHNVTYCNVKGSFSKDRKECTLKAYVCA